ncbi:DUF1746-domain-containing protein [Xylariomycetidae sp. FL2044]|nr:DUF1746-domain-containing protein [Xylariomycetidae sp. FL2044]
MNNASTPTSPADPHIATQPDSEDSADGEQRPTDTPHHQQHGRSSTRKSSLSQRAKDGLSKKLQLMSHLSLNLDTLVYAELCSFFRLLIRWVTQSLFVSPKSGDTILIIPNYHVSAIASTNILCVFLHLISGVAQASEASRGYLHGGLLIDFIGQKPPSSRFTLILLDIVVIGLQCFMLTINMEKERVRTVLKPPRPNSTTSENAEPSTTTQDLDAEERGVLRGAPRIEETTDIEMRSFGDDAEDGAIDSEGAGLLRGAASSRQNDLESLNSGNAIVATFRIPHSLRSAWQSRENSAENAAAFAIQNVGYNATLAALAAQRRARLAAAQQR